MILAIAADDLDSDDQRCQTSDISRYVNLGIDVNLLLFFAFKFFISTGFLVSTWISSTALDQTNIQERPINGPLAVDYHLDVFDSIEQIQRELLQKQYTKHDA